MKTRMRIVILVVTLGIMLMAGSVVTASPLGKLLVRSYNGSD